MPYPSFLLIFFIYIHDLIYLVKLNFLKFSSLSLTKNYHSAENLLKTLTNIK